MRPRGALAELLRGSPFQAYVYSYPHKTTYRAIGPPQRMRDVWAEEDRSALFLYVHVPFCEQRCGYCNLFTQSRPPLAAVTRYLDALERQAAVVAEQVEPAGFARMAIGGGTPTLLDASQLRRVFRIAAGLGVSTVPSSVEISPPTADEDRLSVLREAGVSRVSIGVQSAHEGETSALRRRQRPDDAAEAVRRLRRLGFPVVNVDLMYGQDGQTVESLITSVDSAIAWGANELYLYPLYVRPATTLGRLGRAPSDHQFALFLAARDHLARLGWIQHSLRFFSAPDRPQQDGPRYRCQEDGMIGLGPGARSYTRRVHYASRYAVDQRGVRSLIDAWSAQSPAEFSLIRHGFLLDAEEQRRRYAILCLLEDGLDETAYRARFGTGILEDLPELAEAVELDLVAHREQRWRLTQSGLERSDVIGRWLFSARVEELMARWTPCE
jgi:oxygen-independent coproporphyrinogen-3 oxidase